ncbi:MFS transporter, partial [Sphingorhabdus sp.]|uniref:POT-type proton-dependent oligopeptide transporter n=1 Tax=Sphingorhabdus sp. TaxID=1902408 RepID=UPI003BB126BC
MALGHFLMAFESSFLFALIALIVGVGLFKGNIASQVGELYKPEDLRRAMAFQIFYIAINVSVIVAPLVAGTLGEKVGWHWGFGTAGVVMVIGLILYIMAGPWLPTEKRTPKVAGANAAKEPLVRQDWLRIVAVVALVPILAVALLTNQQIFNAYIVWADTEFDLSLPAALANLSFQMWLPFLGERVIGLPNPLPTSWMITIDAIASFLMLAAVAAFYIWYGKKRQEPDELGKMIIGSFFTIAGGLCLYMAAVTQGSGKIGLFWPLMFHLFNSIGFAHILPVSLAFFTKLAPKAINATIVGIYYLSFFGANKIVGEVGTWYETMATPTFWLFHVGTAVVGLIAFVIFKLFLAKRLLGG